jgi:Fe-S cluster assembly protein SufD
MSSHQARDTACDLVWRGVADERARGVFHGAITVCAGADGADALLSNKNLLLSPIRRKSIPSRCLKSMPMKSRQAHGATVGQLDRERALFYLRSRGIDESAARSLLTAGVLSHRVRFDHATKPCTANWMPCCWSGFRVRSRLRDTAHA